MKAKYYTCLVYREQADGSKKLVNVSVQDWYAQTQEDRGLSGDDRRYYTRDYYKWDESGLDCLIVEVDRRSYRAWNAARMRHQNHYDAPEDCCQMVSLDAPVPGTADSRMFGDIVGDMRENPQADCEIEEFLADLRRDLKDWKPWALKMLDLSQCGYFDDSSELLAEQFGVSSRQVRTYKAQFLQHVKEFVRRWVEQGEMYN